MVRLNENDGPFQLLIYEVSLISILIVVLYHHSDRGNTKTHNERRWINVTSFFLLSGEAAPNIRCGDAGIHRMV